MLGQVENLRESSWHPAPGVRQATLAIGTAVWATVAVREPASPPVNWALTLGLVGLFWLLAARGGWRGRFLAVLGLCPLVFWLAWSAWSGRSLIHPRYLSLLQPVWLASLAVACGLLSRLGLLAVAGGLLGLQAAACAANWDAIGPASAPGMRKAMAEVGRRHAAGEPVVVDTHLLLFTALYYAGPETRPRIATTIPTRQMLRAAQLKQEDLIHPAEVLGHGPSGIWCLSYADVRRPPGPWFPLPEGWWLEWMELFPQDNPWETPIVVEHWVQARPWAAQGP
jgi:hypothetical protein